MVVGVQRSVSLLELAPETVVLDVIFAQLVLVGLTHVEHAVHFVPCKHFLHSRRARPYVVDVELTTIVISVRGSDQVIGMVLLQQLSLLFLLDLIRHCPLC